MELNPSPYITQLIGICNDSFITEYHPYGEASRFSKVMVTLPPRYASVTQRLSMCIDYVQIIHFLQNSPAGVLLMCDANGIWASLRQFLLRDDMKLILNDVDSLQKVDGAPGGTVCNKRKHIAGTLIAPEQRWPHIHLKRYEYYRQH